MNTILRQQENGIFAFSSIHQQRRFAAVVRLNILLLLFTFCVTTARSQAPYFQPTASTTTPFAEEPGAPVGSYPLSGFDNVNLFNGHLNFALPIMRVGGRGSAGYTMMLSIEQHWQVITVPIPTCDQSGCSYPTSNYRYIANPIWWTGIRPGLSPGVLQGRQSGTSPGYFAACNGNIYDKTLTRLTFTAPDGTETELRDKQTGGQPLQGGGCFGGPSRGKVFVSADGSAMTFVSDADIFDDRQAQQPDVIKPSGYLLFRDGTRYRIDTGKVTEIRDNNGNKVSFVYSGDSLSDIYDSLNRHIATFTPDGITFKGADGVVRHIKIYQNSLSTALRKHPDGSTEYTTKTFAQLFSLQNPQNGTFDIPVTTAVELPDGRKYEFRYDSYANLAQVILPTGGRIDYDWQTSTYQFGEFVWGVASQVLERRTALNTTTSSYETKTHYSVGGGNSSASFATVDTLDPKNGDALLARSKHYFYGHWLTNPNSADPYPGWKDGREYQTEYLAADGSTVLQRFNMTWKQRASVNWWTGSADFEPPNDARLIETLATQCDTNQVSKTTAVDPNNPTGPVGYDQYNNQTKSWEYDYGTGAPGALIRQTVTSYLTSDYDTLLPNTTSPDLSLTTHIRNRPVQVSVFDAGGTERARTIFEYDNYASDSYHAPLVNRSNISGHDAAVSTSYTKRGNATAASRYLLPAGTAITSYKQYDIAGNVVKFIDPRSTTQNIIATTIAYDDNFGAPDSSLAERFTFTELGSQQTFAFPTQVTNALNQSAFSQYDYYLGQAINQQDLNGTVIAGYHNDYLDRLTQVRRGFGTTAENQTTFAYDDANHTLTSSNDLSTLNDNVLVIKSIYDGLGRSIESQQFEGGSNYVAIKTEFDGAGRAKRTSNPYRPWQNETPAWTTRTFDALGRVTSLTTPDNSVVSTSYLGVSETMTDQAGKVRKNVTDALGRVKQVYEGPSGSTFLTTYEYDVLNDLTKVIQDNNPNSPQQPPRLFVYDSMKRMISQTLPESGTTLYQYDNNANVTQKTDARGVVTTYVYDALNRTLTVDYSNTTISPDVSRVYDGATNGIGRIWYHYAGGTESTGTNVEKIVMDSYDALGRPLALRQLFKNNGVWSNPYPASRTYNRAGAVTSQIYPSTRTVNYNYDSAGRLADKDAQNLGFTGNLGGSQRTYSSGISYAPAGQMTQEQFGTSIPIYNKLLYNSRQQLAELRASTVGGDTSWNRGKIVNSFSLQCSGVGCNATDNNGDLRKQQVFVPADDQVTSSTSWYQQYDYDDLNRLLRVHEYTGNTSLDWQQEYVYDQWGNRKVHQTNTWGTDIPKPNFGVDITKNQLTAPAGFSMTYDSAGNLTNDTYTGVGSRTYDAENRMTSAVGGNGQSQDYTYDADGLRTRRKINGVETWQVYGFAGELLAEYPANGDKLSPQKEYGYRNGELLVIATPGSGSDQSLSLNGTGAHVQAPNSSSLNISGAFTAEAWIKVNAITGAYQDIVTRESWNQPGTGGGFELSISNSGKLRLDTYQGPSSYTPLVGGTTITAGAWHHVAGVFDGSQMRLYVDGVLDVTLSTTNGPASGTSSLKIGKASYGSYFGGLIDEVRVSNSAVYTGNFTPQAHLTASSSTKGLWKFDGQSTADSSGNGNAGSVQSGATYSTDVPAGPSTSYYSGSFNGTGAHVQAPNSTSLNISGAFTAEAWIKVNAITGAYQDIVTRESWNQPGTGGGFELSISNSGKLRLDTYQGPSSYTPLVGGTTITAGAWHHVAGVFDGSQMRLYVDGVLDVTLSTTNGPASGTSSLKIGKASYGSYFGGLIDEVRVSNSAVYSSNFTPQTHLTASSGTKGLWKFDGQSTADSSGNGNDGTLQSGATYSDDVPSGDGGGGSSGGSGSGAQVQWVVSDQLGTPRMIFDQSGTLANVKRHDYLPFGEELGAQGLRYTLPAYSGSDGVRQKFTSYERDTETQLDYARARYYASAQGRFTSIDPMAASAGLTNPQSWNRYAYVLNNPLTFIDPTGMSVDSGGPDCKPHVKCTNQGRPAEDPPPVPKLIQKPPTVLGDHGEIPGSGDLVVINNAPDDPKSQEPSQPQQQPQQQPQSQPAGDDTSGRGFGFGVTVSGTIAGGAGVAGAGATGGGFWGHFYDGSGWGTQGGGLQGGAEAYIHTPGARAVSPRPTLSAVGVTDDDSVTVIGRSAGGGVGAFFTNAARVEELRGPFQTYQLNTPLISIQWDRSGPVFVFSVTKGPGVGYSYWSGKTAAITTPSLPMGFPNIGHYKH